MTDVNNKGTLLYSILVCSILLFLQNGAWVSYA